MLIENNDEHNTLNLFIISHPETPDMVKEININNPQKRVYSIGNSGIKQVF